MLGLLAWSIRYVLLGLGNAGSGMWMFYVAILTFLTSGLGMFIGGVLSGGAVDYFTTTVGGVRTRNWSGFWMSSAASAFAILLFLAFFFRSEGKAHGKQAEMELGRR